MKHALHARRLENPNQGHSHFPHHFQSSYEYLLHYQSEDFDAHQMVIKIPPNYVDY